MYVPRLRNHTTAGFSMVELALYILIVGILAAAVLYFFQGIQQRASFSTTKTNLRMLKINIDMYYTDESKYPASLNVLVKAGFMKKGALRDGWGNDFRYKVTTGAKKPYELYSFGPSGPQGTKEERINAWDL